MEYENVEIFGEAKIQAMGGNLFIYLPVKRCEKRGIVKGSRILYTIKNTGLTPEPPKEMFKAVPHPVKEAMEKDLERHEERMESETTEHIVI